AEAMAERDRLEEDGLEGAGGEEGAVGGEGDGTPRPMILIVVGAHLRAEEADRPIAYALREKALAWLDARSGGANVPAAGLEEGGAGGGGGRRRGGAGGGWGWGGGGGGGGPGAAAAGAPVHGGGVHGCVVSQRCVAAGVADDQRRGAGGERAERVPGGQAAGG